MPLKLIGFAVKGPTEKNRQEINGESLSLSQFVLHCSDVIWFYVAYFTKIHYGLCNFIEVHFSGQIE